MANKKLTPAQSKKFHAAAIELAEVKAVLKTNEARKKELEELLSPLSVGKYEFEDLTISITEVMLPDTDAIEEAFPADKRPEFYKLAVDTAEFKKHFSPIELRKYQKPSRRTNVAL